MIDSGLCVPEIQVASTPSLQVAKQERDHMYKTASGVYGEALIRLELSYAKWPLVLPCQGVGIDILAVDQAGTLIGISVKCRDRRKGKQDDSTYIFRERENFSAEQEIDRFRGICDLLVAKAWIAVVTIMPECPDKKTPEYSYAHLTSLQHYEDTYMSRMARNKDWKMTRSWLAKYAADPAVLGNKIPNKQGIWTLPQAVSPL